MQKARWYVVHVYSGSEKKFVEAVKEQSKKRNMEDQILEVLLPMEEVVEIKKGARVSSERNVFPGYILVKMVMTDETWQIVKNAGKVTSFLGANGRPSPVTEAEVQRIMKQVQEIQLKASNLVSFSVGESVRISDGPFNSFNGIVEDVDFEKERLKVSVSIFGRPTPVDLTFEQVEKI
jgi:transcriptional antiterminator NusG